MSDNTQEQGRSYYTERDFTFTPPADADVVKTNLIWVRALLEQTRLGDPTFDPVAKAAAMNKVDPGELVGQVPEPEPQEPTFNEAPIANATKPDGSMLNGKGISGQYASNVTDKVIELTLVPINAGKKVIGPAVDGVYPQATSEISVLFGVTADGEFDTDVFDYYDIDLSLDGTSALHLVDGTWEGVNDASYRLTDSAVNDKTIQNVTRARFLVDGGLVDASTNTDEVWAMKAVHKESGETIEVTVTVPKATI